MACVCRVSRRQYCALYIFIYLLTYLLTYSLAACQRHTPSSLAAVIGLSNNDVI